MPGPPRFPPLLAASKDRYDRGARIRQRVGRSAQAVNQAVERNRPPKPLRRDHRVAVSDLLVR
jgi:hypothetical protein